MSTSIAVSGTETSRKRASNPLSLYLPWWLHELIQESVDPVPVEELENEDVDFSGNGCAKWQSEYPKEGQKAAISNTLCFNLDGTVKELFARNVGVSFGDYQQYGDKTIARSMTVWPPGRTEVEGKVSVLEALNSNETLFSTPKQHCSSRSNAPHSESQFVKRPGI